jgi:hypothetical protein
MPSREQAQNASSTKTPITAGHFSTLSANNGSARAFTSPELHRSNLPLADRTKVIRVLHLSRRSLMIREEVTARYAQ